MKKVLLFFLIIITILCSCSTIGEKVYYENEEVLIYEPNKIKVDKVGRVSTDVTVKNKKNKTIILAYLFTYSNGEREIDRLFGIERLKLNPFERKKMRINVGIPGNLAVAFDEGYKYLSIIKDSIVVIDYGDMLDYFYEYKKEYEMVNNKELSINPYSDEILLYVERYILNTNPPKIYTAEYLNEKYYSDNMFGLYCDVPRAWNRKIYDNKYVFSTFDIKFTVIKINVDRKNQSVLDIIDKHMISVVEKEYNIKLIVDDKRNLSVNRKDFSRYDSVLVKGHFVKDNVRTNVWIRYIERDIDSIFALLTEEENQQYYSKYELEAIIRSFKELSHEDLFDDRYA